MFFFFFAVQTFSQTLFQRRREALDLIFRDEADSEWEEDASEWEDNTEENWDHRPAHEAGRGETFVSKGSFFFMSSPSNEHEVVKLEKEMASVINYGSRIDKNNQFVSVRSMVQH